MSLTVSIGVTAGIDSPAVREMIKQTDLALYDAKRSGRNRVCGFVYV